jgi:hypothetical protein
LLLHQATLAARTAHLEANIEAREAAGIAAAHSDYETTEHSLAEAAMHASAVATRDAETLAERTQVMFSSMSVDAKIARRSIAPVAPTDDAAADSHFDTLFETVDGLDAQSLGSAPDSAPSTLMPSDHEAHMAHPVSPSVAPAPSPSASSSSHIGLEVPPPTYADEPTDDDAACLQAGLAHCLSVLHETRNPRATIAAMQATLQTLLYQASVGHDETEQLRRDQEHAEHRRCATGDTHQGLPAELGKPEQQRATLDHTHQHLLAAQAEATQLDHELAEQEHSEQHRADHEDATHRHAEQELAHQRHAECEHAEQHRAEHEEATRRHAEQELAHQQHAEHEHAEQHRAEHEEANRLRAEHTLAQQRHVEHEHSEQQRADHDEAHRRHAEQDLAQRRHAEQEQSDRVRTALQARLYQAEISSALPAAPHDAVDHTAISIAC